jgi:hypothetical protein
MIFKKICMGLGILLCLGPALANEFIFDQSLEQVYSPFETGFTGFSTFNKNLKKWGLSISVNNFPLDLVLKDLKGPGNILFLGVAINQKYSQESLNALDDFLKRGGGILLTVEHDNLFKNATFQNAFIEKYGISTQKFQALAKEKSWKKSIWPFCSSSNFNLQKIQMYLPAPLKIKGDAKTLLYVENPLKKDFQIVGAWKKVGKGNLVVLGDVEIFWNMTSNTGIRQGNNLVFMKNIVELLAPGKELNSNYPKFQNNPSPKGKVLFYLSGEGVGPDSSLSGFSRFAQYLNSQGYSIKVGKEEKNFEKYSLVVVAAPVEKVKNIPGLIRAKKILLISDGQSNVLDYSPEFVKILKEGMGLRLSLSDYLNPANEILKNWGYRFFDGTLISPKSNHFFIDSGMVSLYRSTFIEKLNIKQTSKGQSFWVVTGEEAFPMNSFVPASDDGKTGLPFKLTIKREFESGYPVGMYWKNLMAISDLEILSNQFFQGQRKEKFLNQFKKWLDYQHQPPETVQE